VIANYRTPLPTVRERQWRVARENLAQALTVAPSNNLLKASLRYVDGHLHRIDGEAAKRRRQTLVANQHFTEAVTAFREAAELRPRWPDPFLGLARTFVYGLDDIDRAADAMNQAQRFGYTPGDRETAQLADGYFSRAETLVRTSRQLAGLPQEVEYLHRAEAAYREALSRYERIPNFAGSITNLRRIQAALDRIQKRLMELAAADVLVSLAGAR
jgi:tetratricopeptide (TPR) repeat protein